jgi:hypothetical protein
LTDYLELLLPEEERQEEETALQWEEPVLLGLERALQGAEKAQEILSQRREEAAARVRSASGAADAGERGGETASPRSALSETAAAAAAAQTQEAARTEGRQGESLYRQVLRLSREADSVRRESQGTVRTVTVPGERESGLTAEQLDRMVQRDARRYDGGFPLYG